MSISHPILSPACATMSPRGGLHDDQNTQLSTNAILEQIDIILSELHDLRLTVQELAQVDASQSAASRPDRRQLSEPARALLAALYAAADSEQRVTKVLAESGKFYMPTQPRSTESSVNESPVPITGKPVSAIVLEQRGSYDPE